MKYQRRVLAAAFASCMIAPAHADKVFAHSKSLDMSFTALGEPWCREDVRMQVSGGDAGRFATEEYLDILQKLGHVLVRECAEAQTMSIEGRAGDRSVWTGRAERGNGWIAQQIPVSPPAAAVAGSEPASAPPAAATASIPDAPAAAQSAPASAPASASTPTPTPTPAAAAETVIEPAPAAPPALEIAGWKPGGLLRVSGEVGEAQEITSRTDGCRIRAFFDLQARFGPSFEMTREYDCINGYVHSRVKNRPTQARFYYEGQNQPFATLNGYWVDGFNLDRGLPRQVVARNRTTTTDRWNRSFTSDKLLVWLGQDPELRAHYFATYVNGNNQVWRLENTPLIVLTDNDALKADPAATTLAQSITAIYRDFYGYSNTNQFSQVSFVITDSFSLTPTTDYQKNLNAQNPDTAFHKAGRALRQRGTPWMVQVDADFAAKRAAFAEAERRRAEMERQRLAQLRAQHQSSLDRQYQELVNASPYDRVRFYATLQLAKEQLARHRIDFTSTRAYHGSALGGALVLAHPAQYLNQVDAGRVRLPGPLHLLVEADDGEIEAPYAMQVSHNASGVELDGWMLIRMEPEFGFEFDAKGRPVFEIAVDQAVACMTDKCLEEMEVEDMMKAWYEDDDMEFNLAANP
ncbi:translational repressor [Thiohalobacter thiocyanaticus]|uniref:Translational repressor n=1 Tax=Thiohalobacter thiocyanaticus TaxID=585455 RepID=A0A1Z4VS66_9GAMM|nr:hypothetical protein [Thiohalobacter thiocyanaticus]BAZ94476.1 translational repressor [Thiohalobacter thiocyanaticus]